MGDELSALSIGDETRISVERPTLRQKNKTATTKTNETTISPQPICYLVQGEQTQGTLIEHYSETLLPNTTTTNILAYWSTLPGSTVPKFKFTKNFGKSEICNATQGDLRGKRAYYSGICQWLRSAKTFNGTFTFVNHVAGWECDVYLYFNCAHDGVQTALVRDGEAFPVYLADGVAIVPRGSDFIHYDPRFQCNIDKWLSEGSKLGFATKLEVRAGCALPKNNNSSSHRAIGDAARPTGGASYNEMSKNYARGKERSEMNRVQAYERRVAEGQAREEAERQAAKFASEQASKEMKCLEERERARVEKERLDHLEIVSSGKKIAKEDVSRSKSSVSSSNASEDVQPNNKIETVEHEENVSSGKSGRQSADSGCDGDAREGMQATNKTGTVEHKSRMQVGMPVYIRDPHYSWLPASVESEEDDKKRVKVRVRLPFNWEDHTITPQGRGVDNMKLERLVKLSDYTNDELPLQNLERDGVTAMGKNDMADLPNLHEAAILYNLKARHSEGNPYTRVGDIMVAMNPFQVRFCCSVLSLRCLLQSANVQLHVLGPAL